MTKFKIEILKHGSETENILKLIESHNGGVIPLSLEDFISWGQCRKALYPVSNKGFQITRTDSDDKVLCVSEDGGESLTITIEECEMFELEMPDDIPEIHVPFT